MRRLIAGLGIGLFCTQGALASGGLSCEGEGAGSRIEIQSGVTRGMGSPVFDFKARAEIGAADVAEDLRNVAFEREHLAQYWLGDGELKLVLHWERQGDLPHAEVQITMRTTGSEDGDYSGTYELSLFGVIDDLKDNAGSEMKLDGKASCFVE